MASFRPRTNIHAPQGIGRAFSGALRASVGALMARRERTGRSAGTLWMSGVLLIGGIALGMLISTNWQAQSAATDAASPLTRQSGREMVAFTINRLEAEQAELKKQIADMRAQVGTMQGTDTQRKSTLLDIKAEIDRQRVASGMVALHGPGVVATFNDSTAKSIPQNEDPARYILHEYDLRDIVNALWIAGAEGISLNGERIVGTTSLYCVGTTVICNVTRLSPPYEIRAIGDPDALMSALTGSPQMEKFNQRAQIYDLPVKIEPSRSILVPAYNGSLVFKYATVQGDE
ncbi:MAG TPA: DUF881 domain-containing protein [Chloroflexia bacterium]